MKLNGWQRVWVLIAVIYFIPILILTLVFLPTKKEIYNHWYSDLNERSITLHPNFKIDDIRFINSDLSDQQIIGIIENKLMPFEIAINTPDPNYKPRPGEISLILPENIMHPIEAYHKKYTVELDSTRKDDCTLDPFSFTLAPKNLRLVFKKRN